MVFPADKEKMNLVQTESAKGSHGLLRYASTSCYGGTTPCPKVNKNEKDYSGGVHEKSKKPIIKRSSYRNLALTTIWSVTAAS